MKITSAKFVKSSPDFRKCPEPNKPEYAFIGRSNVGKSSLINAITNHKKLAKTSGTPGKTQLINHFEINDWWYLVDLPGYGFAKISKTMRAKWEKMIMDYLYQRPNLMTTFILIDSRLEPQKLDKELIEWFGSNQLPFTLVFTKSDKLTKKRLGDSLQVYKNYLKQQWEELPPMIVSSAVQKLGVDEILDVIEESNMIFQKQ
ncbi:MAG: YihA family ribosome biogenesis GTP-binding protein [Bacteroidetes bacterium]|nr:MAG: YihA family ribosome biogenesis GTP-binding protein [Bacteroidota bacterium]